jgi:formate hydrogenlyase transcriptional activator
MQTYGPSYDRERSTTDAEGHANYAAAKSDADLLLAIVDVIGGSGAFPDLLEDLAPLLCDLAHCEVESFSLYDPAEEHLVTHIWQKEQGAALANFPADNSPCGWAWHNQQPLTIPDIEQETRFPDAIRVLRGLGVRSYLALPLTTITGRYGALGLGRSLAGMEGARDLDFLRRVAQLIAVTIENRQLRRESQEFEAGTEKISRPSVTAPFEIVGKSSALRRVLDYASIVARTDATVLITGETGTGKECVAHSIHMMSSRRDHGFVKLNCAAAPTGLLESELFGHEKGAFTGAVSPKAGRLEMADNGTLLLDEVGEIPLELQPKLLRVLQDQEFERLGSTRTLHVNVRLIASSNRDLVRAVGEKQFRGDLFYRLQVFPLHLPPLRERRDDIPLLIRYFVERCAARSNKRIDFIPDDAVEVMMNYGWPGNIRELENFIERSVILSDSNRLRPPLGELCQQVAQSSRSQGTLRERERNHIIEVLRQTRGILSGPAGAAGRLGLKRTTLQYKMQKLGISRHDYLD